MSDLTKSGIKIFNAHAKLGTRPLTAEELAEFLGTPELLVRLGTIDEKGEPDTIEPKSILVHIPPQYCSLNFLRLYMPRHKRILPFCFYIGMIGLNCEKKPFFPS